ncbi:hypothetical protein FOZ61_010864 [Perkinsus olseni]|uniref:Uncharacterized protein n=1 Tax=Perkinsus olseni TaxID=32597 RepID=A0A7J6KV90_PEROL|nr:hypothetical protein FOZ61_010864 [Perkinsus olseni]KAF4652724.1 hypothetical protein FOL46_009540 [Perkinsus olseni]
MVDNVLGTDEEAVSQARAWLGSGLLFDHLTSDIAQIRDTCSEEWGQSLKGLQDLWQKRRVQVRRRLAGSRRLKNEHLKAGDVVWKKNYNVDKFGNLFTGSFTVTATEGVTISIGDKGGQTSVCGIHQLKRGGAKIKIAREGVDIIKKAASAQTETELTRPALDESDLRQWRYAVMNEEAMTRSKESSGEDGRRHQHQRQQGAQGPETLTSR